jgi:hypothetical protein
MVDLVADESDESEAVAGIEKHRLLADDNPTRLAEEELKKVWPKRSKVETSWSSWVIPIETLLRAKDGACSTFESVTAAYPNGAIAQTPCLVLDEARQARATKGWSPQPRQQGHRKVGGPT